MSEIVESIGADDLDGEHLFEATLFENGSFSINAEDGVGNISLDDLTVDQVREIHEMLGHLLYLYGRS